MDDSASSAGLVVLRADSCSPAVLFLLSPGLGVAAHGHRVGTSRRTTGDMRVDDFASGAASGALQECAHLDQPNTLRWTSVLSRERGCRLLKENAEGTNKTKHAEAARLNYTTTTHRHTDTQTQTHLV